MGKSGTGFGIFTSGNPHMIVRNFGVSLPALGYTDLFRQNSGGQYEKLNAFIERTKAVYGIRDFAGCT